MTYKNFKISKFHDLQKFQNFNFKINIWIQKFKNFMTYKNFQNFITYKNFKISKFHNLQKFQNFITYKKISKFHDLQNF